MIDIKSNKNFKTLWIIGHRGYHAKYPENTSVAFEAAIQAGADALIFPAVPLKSKAWSGCQLPLHFPGRSKLNPGAVQTQQSSLGDAAHEQDSHLAVLFE